MVCLSLSIVLYGCGSNNKIKDTSLTWGEIKSTLNQKKITSEDLNKLLKSSYQVSSDPKEIDEIINTFKDEKNLYIKKYLIKTINAAVNSSKYISGSDFSSNEDRAKAEKIISNPKIIDFYRFVLSSGNSQLQSLAFSGILDLNNYSYKEGDTIKDNWTNWKWSDEIRNLFDTSTNKNLENLSGLDNSALLAIANKYQNSLFVRGCKEYTRKTNGTYFGSKSKYFGVFREPFNPQDESKKWEDFFAKYPNHPGTDDALHRIGRSYEINENYESAVLYFYRASQAFDGLFQKSSKDRILRIIDLLMSKEQLLNFSKNYPNHPLIPYIEYTNAIHLVRDGNYAQALTKLRNFVNKYQDNLLESLVSGNEFLGSDFFNSVKQQIKEVEYLERIHSKPESDGRLYEEAKYWINDNKSFIELPTYNHLWQGMMIGSSNIIIPSDWSATDTYNKYLVTNNLVQTSSQNYADKIGYLRAVKIFNKLIQQYPNSQLLTKSKYSIGVAYYYLWRRSYPVFSTDVRSWNEAAINNFDEFVRNFPSSILADDALYSIAFIYENSGNHEKAKEAVRKILSAYPNGDIATKRSEIINKMLQKK
jgi:TolA-binding protein